MNVPKKALSLILSFALVAGTAISSGAFAEGTGSTAEPAGTSTPEETVDTPVTDIGTLQAALADSNRKTITLGGDIEGITSPVVVSRPVTIDGNGHKLTFSGLDGQANDVNDGLVIGAAGTTVKDLTVDAGLGESKGAWVGTYAIQVYKASDVTLENVTATGGNGGILVNGSDVTLSGRIDVSGNGFGGIESSKGDGVETDLSLNAEGATLVNKTEALGFPTIWEDNITGTVTEGTITALHLTQKKVTITDDGKTTVQQQYYLDKGHSSFAAELNGTSYETLDGAISAAQDGETVKLLSNVNFTSSLEVKHAITIDGNGHTLSFTGLENVDENDGVDDGLILEANGITVKNLTVDAGLENPGEWVGTYAIQAFDVNNVTLENVTAKGGNGGILVNGSDVTLKGKIDVSGNGTGGINVSKEEDVKTDPVLHAENATLVNTSEKTFAKVEKETNPTLAFWNPTIWVDKVSEEPGSNAVSAPDLFMTEFQVSENNYYLYFLKIEDSGNPYLTVKGVPQTVQTEKAVTENENTIGKITTFDTTGRTPINVTLHKGAAGYPNVRVVVGVRKNGQATTDGIQLLAKDTNNVWWNIAKTGWGPGSGFALQDATTPVYLVASEPGTYTATIQLVNVANSNAVLAETTAKVTAVNTAAPVQLAPKKPEVTGSDSTITDALANATPGEDLGALAQQETVERFEGNKTSKDDQGKINSVADLPALEDDNSPVVVVAQPYLNINAKGYNPEAGILELEITPKCKLVATSKTIADSLATTPENLKTFGNDQNGVEISDTAIDVPSGSAVTLTIPLSSTFQVPAGGLQVKHVKTNGDVYYYPAIVTPATEGAPATATFTVTHGFSDFTLQAADTRKLTVDYDSGVLDATYSITDVGSALPTASKPGYDFNGWTFGGVNGTYTTLTDALWNELMGEAQTDQTVTATAQFTKQSSGNPGGTPVVPEQPEEPTATYKSDTTYDLTVNGAYTFLITSLNGKKPSFAVGTPGVFRTELVHTVGNDYYYKITAIGKAGSQAGIYLNGGSRLLVATVGKPASDVWCDTPSPFTLAAGSAYQFKFVAGEKPSLACGNDKVFQLRFVRQSGDEYYYRIAAVGKKGDCAGFYLNGEKSPSIRVTVW